MKQFHLKIYGQVQGVGMRYFIAHHAKKMGLCGYVKNIPDGTVECIIEGDEKLLDSFYKIIASKSPGKIESINKHETKFIEGFKEFDVRYF